MNRSVEKVKPEFRLIPNMQSLIREENQAKLDVMMKFGKMADLVKTIIQAASEIESLRVDLVRDVPDERDVGKMVEAADDLITERDKRNVDDFLNGKVCRLKQAADQVRRSA